MSASAARSGTQGLPSRRAGSRSTLRRPSCARRARRSILPSPSGSCWAPSRCVPARCPVALLGELGLDGEVRPVPGILPMVAALAGRRIGRVVVAPSAVDEARLVEGIDVIGAASLADAAELVRGRRPRRVPVAMPRVTITGPAGASADLGARPAATVPASSVPDLAEVRGQVEARRGLEIALAGGHGLLLTGPPGVGKTLLARTIPGLLPPLDDAAALSVSIVASAAGEGPITSLRRQPPFRSAAPHAVLRGHGRWWTDSLPGRDHACPSRRAVPRRAGRVRSGRPRGAPSAAGGGPGPHRAGRPGHDLPRTLPARGSDEPVPVRIRRVVARGSLPVHDRRDRSLRASGLGAVAGPDRPVGVDAARAGSDARRRHRPGGLGDVAGRIAVARAWAALDRGRSNGRLRGPAPAACVPAVGGDDTTRRRARRGGVGQRARHGAAACGSPARSPTSPVHRPSRSATSMRRRGIDRPSTRRGRGAGVLMSLGVGRIARRDPAPWTRTPTRRSATRGRSSRRCDGLGPIGFAALLARYGSGAGRARGRVRARLASSGSIATPGADDRPPRSRRSSNAVAQAIAEAAQDGDRDRGTASRARRCAWSRSRNRRTRPPRRDRDAAARPVRPRPARRDVARRAVAVVGTRRATGRDGRRPAGSPRRWRPPTRRSCPDWRSGSTAPRTRRRCERAARRSRSSVAAMPASVLRAHARLAEAIVASGGAVVSELAPDVPPSTGTFPRRNRIISGLTDATVVVEAPARSGALITASWALEQGRACFLVPGPHRRRRRPAAWRSCANSRRRHIVAGVPQLIADLGLRGRRGAGIATPWRRRPSQDLGRTEAAVARGARQRPRHGRRARRDHGSAGRDRPRGAHAARAPGAHQRGSRSVPTGRARSSVSRPRSAAGATRGRSGVVARPWTPGATLPARPPQRERATVRDPHPRRSPGLQPGSVLRKYLVAILAVPVLVGVYAASLLGRVRYVRGGVAIGLGAVVGPRSHVLRPAEPDDGHTGHRHRAAHPGGIPDGGRHELRPPVAGDDRVQHADGARIGRGGAVRRTRRRACRSSGTPTARAWRSSRPSTGRRRRTTRSPSARARSPPPAGR